MVVASTTFTGDVGTTASTVRGEHSAETRERSDAPARRAVRDGLAAERICRKYAAVVRASTEPEESYDRDRRYMRRLDLDDGSSLGARLR